MWESSEVARASHYRLACEPAGSGTNLQASRL